MMKYRRKLNQVGEYGRSVMIPADWLKFHKMRGYHIREVELEVYEDRIIIHPVFGKKEKTPIF